jgi:high-affinity Fe2+/Pb2+ permease
MSWDNILRSELRKAFVGRAGSNAKVDLYMDPVTVMNLLFDLVIFLMGLLVYKEKKAVLPLWVAVAFCLFAVSYALTIVGVASSLILIPLRAIGYLSVIVGLVLQRKH